MLVSRQHLFLKILLMKKKTMMKKEKGRVFDIQRFSVHDGPGIRTNIFFKGCKLKCSWCCNPEGQSRDLQLGYLKEKCIGCEKCLNICANNAIEIRNGVKTFRKEICEKCIDKPCVEVCSAGALRIFGWDTTMDDLVSIVEKDEMFYFNSGGGVTVSGGEPLLQSSFIQELLIKCKCLGYNVVVETCLYCTWDDLKRVKDYTDFFLCDIKHINSEKFRQYTGGDIFIVYENLKKLSRETKNIIVRIPVISEFNDDINTISLICKFVKGLGINTINLLPYHALGIYKYEKLFLKYTLKEIQSPCMEKMEELKNICIDYGLNAEIGG